MLDGARYECGAQFYHRCRVSWAGEASIHDFSKESAAATAYEQEALQFLYAYMPVADATDYSYSYYLNNVRATFKAQQEMAWGQTVPELLFRHFVLPLRVNNEALDNARIEFYKELKDRVKGLGMKDAILEVNHWCHEHVTYQPSDARTLSPMAPMPAARNPFFL